MVAARGILSADSRQVQAEQLVGFPGRHVCLVTPGWETVSRPAINRERTSPLTSGNQNWRNPKRYCSLARTIAPYFRSGRSSSSGCGQTRDSERDSSRGTALSHSGRAQEPLHITTVLSQRTPDQHGPNRGSGCLRESARKTLPNRRQNFAAVDTSRAKSENKRVPSGPKKSFGAGQATDRVAATIVAADARTAFGLVPEI